MPDKKSYGFQTRCIHGHGHVSDGRWRTARPVSVPIVQTSTFAFESAEHGAAIFAGENDGFLYTRLGNPTQEALECRLAALEGGEAALALASGMAACTTAVLTLCGSGDHVVSGDTLYGGTHQLFTHTLPRLGVTVTEVDATDPDNFERAITPATKLLYVETPANPTLVLTDLPAVAAIGRRHGIPLLVDNTFCTPVLQRPLELGADIVLHSATKYIGGHGDAIAGILVGSSEFITRARFETLRDIGGCISPFNAWLLIRGLKTLAVRVRQHGENAMTVAKWLEKHPKVTRVIYPGLPTHPQHELAKRQGRLRRPDQLPGRGRPRRRPHGDEQRGAVHPGGEPRGRGHPHRASRHDDPQHLLGGGAAEGGHRPGDGPALGGARGPRGCHRGPRAGVRPDLSPRQRSTGAPASGLAASATWALSHSRAMRSRSSRLRARSKSFRTSFSWTSSSMATW